MSSSIVLTFSPALPCIGYECQRETVLGQLSPSEDSYLLSPVCWEHGFMWECSEDERRASIERFVVEELGGKGSARVISPCLPGRVPGHQVQVNEVTEAWLVDYTDEQAYGRRVYVLWDSEDFAFDLFF